MKDLRGYADYLEDYREKKHVIMHPAYGYVNEDDEYTGFDMECAALFSDEDIDTLLDDTPVDRDDLTIVSFTKDQLDADLPFGLPFSGIAHPDTDKRIAGISPEEWDEGIRPENKTVETEKFALFHPSYGYLNKDVEFTSFDLEDAALYTDADVERFDLDTTAFIKQPFTDKQLEDVPFKDGLPTVLETPFGYGDNTPENMKATDSTANVVTPEFDFADFGKGLDDLDDVNDHTQNQ